MLRVVVTWLVGTLVLVGMDEVKIMAVVEITALVPMAPEVFKIG